jgi:cell fate regulator YaaT (PSP1 superfamily)
MARLVRVEFGGSSRYQYCTASDLPIRPGEVVVVETDWGVGMGEVQAVLEDISPEQVKASVHPILRKATATDLSRRAALGQREREARGFCRERIQARKLPMKLTEVRIGLDSSKAMFYFTADGRVDFRELVKDLIQHLRTRVELRQIGVRDEAKVLGSSGQCGRPVCCRAFLQGFTPVSIRMAKDQNLALNPGKLSGMCGRLKCCLAFEHSLYAELRHGLPKVGNRVGTCRGPGLVQGLNILEQTIQVGLETGGQVTLRPAEIQIRLRHEAPPGPAAGGASDERSAGGQENGSGAGRGHSRRRGNRRGKPSEPAGHEAQAHEGDDVPGDVAALEKE